MKRITRRDFLKKSATVAATAATGMVAATVAVKTDNSVNLSIQQPSRYLTVNVNGNRYSVRLFEDN